MRRRPNPSTRNFDAIRARSSPLDNAVIDEFLARRIGRREFLRYASVLGISAPLLGALMPGAARAAGKPGGAVTVGMTVPSGSIDPLTVADTGGGWPVLWDGGDFSL